MPTRRRLPFGLNLAGQGRGLPRGWWHVAIPLDEPTLHLTLAIEHRNGSDLLRWVSHDLTRCVDIRADVPHLGSAATRAAYVQALRQTVSAALTDDVIERFMRQVESRLVRRPSLQWSDGSLVPTMLTDDTPLRLVADRRLYFESDEPSQRTVFTAGGQQWACDQALIPALALLRATRATLFRTLASSVPSSCRHTLFGIVTAMLVGGALSAERVLMDERHPSPAASVR